MDAPATDEARADEARADEARADRPKIGQTLRGQAWVELHGTFGSAELRKIADLVDRNCKGLERNPQWPSGTT